jgi:hypothetical protein
VLSNVCSPVVVGAGRARSAGAFRTTLVNGKQATRPWLRPKANTSKRAWSYATRTSTHQTALR